MLNAGAFGNIRQGKYIDWADRRIDASAPGYTARRGPAASILSSGKEVVCTSGITAGTLLVFTVLLMLMVIYNYIIHIRRRMSSLCELGRGRV